MEGQSLGSLTFPEKEPRDNPKGPKRLRETVVDEEMGMPAGGRDLNGDGVIDDEPRDADYKLLPLKVTVRWMGIHGDSSLTVSTWITEK